MCVCVCGVGKSKGRHYGLDSSVNDGAVHQDKKRKGKFWENTFILTVWRGWISLMRVHGMQPKYGTWRKNRINRKWTFPNKPNQQKSTKQNPQNKITKQNWAGVGRGRRKTLKVVLRKERNKGFLEGGRCQWTYQGRIWQQGSESCAWWQAFQECHRAGPGWRGALS